MLKSVFFFKKSGKMEHFRERVDSLSGDLSEKYRLETFGGDRSCSSKKRAIQHDKSSNGWLKRQNLMKN